MAKESWVTYPTEIDTSIAIVVVRSDLIEDAPKARYSHLCIVSVNIDATGPNCLPESDESDMLYAIEEDLCRKMAKVGAAKQVGRVTAKGHLEFYFYAKSTNGLQQTVDQVMSNYADRVFECESRLEEDWSTYLEVLYPSPREWRLVGNQNILQALREHGDPLTEPRTVDHWAYFDTPYDRAAFIQVVQREGFKVRHLDEDPEFELRFMAQIYRIDSVEDDDIDATTLALFDLAESNGGFYDGWETDVLAIRETRSA